VVSRSRAHASADVAQKCVWRSSQGSDRSLG
jgi:hypothetical protein